MTDSALNQLGVKLDEIYASAGDLVTAQGEEYATKNGRVVLAAAAGTISRGELVVIAPSSAASAAAASVSVVATLASTTNLYGGRLAFYQNSAAVSAGKYAWFHTEGMKEVVIKVAANCAPNNATKMYSQANMDGILDDATTSAAILGVEVLNTASGGNTLVFATFKNLLAQDAS